MKNNKLSIILSSASIFVSIAIFIVAYIRFDPFTFTDSSTSFVLTIIIGMLAIAITAVIAVQISYMLGVEKKIKLAIEIERKKIDNKNNVLQSDLRLYARAAYNHSSSIIYLTAGHSFKSFVSKCRAIRDISKVENKNEHIYYDIDFGLKDFINLIVLDREGIIEGLSTATLNSGIASLGYLDQCLLNLKSEKAVIIYNFIKEIKLKERIEELKKEEEKKQNEK